MPWSSQVLVYAYTLAAKVFLGVPVSVVFCRYPGYIYMSTKLYILQNLFKTETTNLRPHTQKNPKNTAKYTYIKDDSISKL